MNDSGACEGANHADNVELQEVDKIQLQEAAQKILRITETASNHGIVYLHTCQYNYTLYIIL